MMNNHGFTAFQRAAGILTRPRATAALGLLVTPAGLKMAEEYARKLRIAEAVMPTAFRTACETVREGGAAEVYGLPQLVS